MKKIMFVVFAILVSNYTFAQFSEPLKVNTIGIGDDDEDGEGLDHLEFPDECKVATPSLIAFPNPVKNVMTLKANKTVVVDIAIYKDGIKQARVSKINNGKVSMASLASGSYTLVAYLENGSVIKKTIIKD